MKKKCAYCFSRLDAESASCRVCKIDPAKDRRALTPAEKKVAYRCRTLYTLGFLCIVGGFIGLFILLPSIFFYLRGQQDKNLATPTIFLPYTVAGMMLINLSLPFYGWFLRRYKKGCYWGGILIFSANILISIPDFHIGKIIIPLFCLYWIISPPSREILA